MSQGGRTFMKKLFGQMAADRKWQARGKLVGSVKVKRISVAWRNCSARRESL